MFACHRTLGFLRSIRALEPQILTSCPCCHGLLDFKWFLRLLTDFDWGVRFVGTGHVVNLLITFWQLYLLLWNAIVFVRGVFLFFDVGGEIAGLGLPSLALMWLAQSELFIMILAIEGPACLVLQVQGGFKHVVHFGDRDEIQRKFAPIMLLLIVIIIDWHSNLILWVAPRQLSLRWLLLLCLHKSLLHTTTSFTFLLLLSLLNHRWFFQKILLLSFDQFLKLEEHLIDFLMLGMECINAIFTLWWFQ